MLTMTFIACAHGRTGDFPALESSPANAEVYVIRDNNLLGWGFSLKVDLDGAIIARLRSGEYVSFNLRPGFHSLGVSKSTLTVPFEKGTKYYFLISADYTQFGFELDRINDRQGDYWLSRTKPVE